MTSYPLPPPPPANRPSVPAAKAPAFGWAAVVAGLLGLLALVLPWYQPHVSSPINRDVGASYHAWSGFIVLVIGPLALIVWAALWIQSLRGQHNSRYANSDNPVRSLSLQTVIAGVVAIVIGLLSTALVTHHYKDWNEATREAKALGSTLSRGPQLGLYLLLVGGAVMIVVGVLGYLAANKGSATALPTGPGFDTSGGYGGYDSPTNFPPPPAPGVSGSAYPSGTGADGVQPPSYPPAGSSPAPGSQPPSQPFQPYQPYPPAPSNPPSSSNPPYPPYPPKDPAS